MPVEKKKKRHAEEEEDEDSTYEPNSSDDARSDDEEDETFQEEDEDSGPETSASSDDETEIPSTSKSLKEVAEASKKQVKTKSVKRKQPTKQVVPAKKQKTATDKATEKKKTDEKKEVKGKKKVKKTDDGDDGGKEKVTKTVEYNDKNVDFNLYNEAPEHIKNVKIKLSSNIVLMSRMIEASGNTTQGLTYDYAAMSFVRQSKNGKAYEFNLPLTLALNVVKGVNLLVKQNPKFFEKHYHSEERMLEQME